MLLATGFPVVFEARVVRNIECTYSAIVRRSISKLLLVRNLLICPTSFLAAFHVIAPIP